MSIDYWEAEQEAAYEEFVESLAKELYEEHKEQAIYEFIEERLQSYYLQNRDIAMNAIQFVEKSKKIVELEPTTSLLYSSIATEVILKSVLLKPVVAGLVHTESLAELVSSILVRQTGIDRFKELVFKILESHITFDNGIANYKREESTDTLWTERSRIQKVRNKIMHQADLCCIEDAKLSYSVASTFFDLTKLLVENIGFRFEANGELVREK
ncbi:hypothetical protein ES705_30000 [subsurface metagenome]